MHPLISKFTKHLMIISPPTDYLSLTNQPTVNTIPLKLLFCIFIITSQMLLDHKKVSCLCLLNLSAAFDTIDHNISWLSSWFGLHGSVLRSFESYHHDPSASSVTEVDLHSTPLPAVIPRALFSVSLSVHDPTRYSHLHSFPQPPPLYRQHLTLRLLSPT